MRGPCECVLQHISSGVPQTLRDAIRQRRPFASSAQEVYLNLVRTAAALQDGVEQVLRPHGLSGAQYNILRILRGAGTDGLCRHEIGERLLTRMPDVTRLLDRLEDAGLVLRTRDDEDRRLVRTRLTRDGRTLVDRLDAPVAAEHERALAPLDEGERRTLVALLERARGDG